MKKECVGNEWKIFALEARVDVLETRLEKALERLEALEAPARETIDLTKEEDEGGLGGPIFLAPETPDVSLVADVRADLESTEDVCITVLGLLQRARARVDINDKNLWAYCRHSAYAMGLCP